MKPWTGTKEWIDYRLIMLELYLKAEFASEGGEIISLPFLLSSLSVSVSLSFIYFLKFYFKICKVYIGEANKNFSQGWKNKCRKCYMECVCLQASVHACAPSCTVLTWFWSSGWKGWLVPCESIRVSPHLQPLPFFGSHTLSHYTSRARYQTARDSTAPMPQRPSKWLKRTNLEPACPAAPFPSHRNHNKGSCPPFPSLLLPPAQPQSSPEWPCRKLSFLSRKLWA